MSPEVARRVIAIFREFRQPASTTCDLTAHELRLLRLFVEGHNYKTAAAELGVTVHTISFHLRSIYEKLQGHSKSAAVAKALRIDSSTVFFCKPSPLTEQLRVLYEFYVEARVSVDQHGSPARSLAHRG